MTSLASPVQEFLAAVDRQDASASALCTSLLGKIIGLEHVPPADDTTEAAVQQQTLACKFFEGAAQCALQHGSTDDFERYFSQLTALYEVPQCESSPKRGVLQAAWLLRLLTGQRFAEFHCELELLAPALAEDAAVQFVLRVEAAMTQGLYGKVLQAVASPPSDLFTPFIADLRDTVRKLNADCLEAAHARMQVSRVGSELLLPADEVMPWVDKHERKWTLEGDMVSFNTAYDKSVHVDHEKLTSAALAMASDLERIV